MLTVTMTPATRLGQPDEYEAVYGHEWAAAVRACPLEACAEALGNALFWLSVGKKGPDVNKEA